MIKAIIDDDLGNEKEGWRGMVSKKERQEGLGEARGIRLRKDEAAGYAC